MGELAPLVEQSSEDEEIKLTTVTWCLLENYTINTWQLLCVILFLSTNPKTNVFYMETYLKSYKIKKSILSLFTVFEDL